jgi:hypothetical protein
MIGGEWKRVEGDRQKLKEIWAIRIRLRIAHRCRDLALFNLAFDSKLRACDLMEALCVKNVAKSAAFSLRSVH